MRSRESGGYLAVVQRRGAGASNPRRVGPSGEAGYPKGQARSLVMGLGENEVSLDYGVSGSRNAP